MCPEIAFYEVGFELVERIRRSQGGRSGEEDQGFANRDEIVRDRVAWCCEECGGGYWARVIRAGK